MLVLGAVEPTVVVLGGARGGVAHGGACSGGVVLVVLGAAELVAVLFSP